MRAGANATSPGRDDDLTRGQVVQAAVELLDEGGLAAFSMRALGERLGRSTMAAYRHVRNKGEVLGLAADAAMQDPPDLGQGPWHERLATLARFGWSTTWKVHPWLVDVQNPHTGAGTIRRLEVTQQLYREAGFDGADLALVLRAHWAFMVGTLKVVLGIPPGDPTDPDTIFEFNLRVYVSGVRAIAKRSPMDGSTTPMT